LTTYQPWAAKELVATEDEAEDKTMVEAAVVDVTWWQRTRFRRPDELRKIPLPQKFSARRCTSGAKTITCTEE
jgi:hypothetical protein